MRGTLKGRFEARRVSCRKTRSGILLKLDGANVKISWKSAMRLFWQMDKKL